MHAAVCCYMNAAANFLYSWNVLPERNTKYQDSPQVWQCKQQQAVLLKLHKQETDQITCNHPFHFFKMENLSLKQHSRVWFGFVLISAHFLTPSFKAACTILSIRNDWFDVSVVCCTTTASFLALLMHSPSECWAGREGSDCWLCSNMSVSAGSLRRVCVCVWALSLRATWKPDVMNIEKRNS